MLLQKQSLALLDVSQLLLAAQFQRLQMRARSLLLVHGCLGCRMTLGNQSSCQFPDKLMSFQGNFCKDDFRYHAPHHRPSETSSASEGSPRVVTGQPHSNAPHSKHKYVLQRLPALFQSASN